MPSMKGHRRTQLMRPRSKNVGFSSIWLAYSEKMNADMSLGGDLELLHWVSELEINPNVRRFNHDEKVSVSLCSDSIDEVRTLKVIYVELQSGEIELHQIDAKDNVALEKVCTPVKFARSGELDREAQLVHVSAARLKDFSKKNLAFWLRVLAFASQVRDVDIRHEMGLVGAAVTLNGQGTIGALIECLAITDGAIAAGAICRMILSGQILVAADERGFGKNTQWRLHER